MELRLRCGATEPSVMELLPYLDSDVVPFLYSSREHRINNAVVLRDYLLHRVK